MQCVTSLSKKMRSFHLWNLNALLLPYQQKKEIDMISKHQNMLTDSTMKVFVLTMKVYMI